MTMYVGLDVHSKQSVFVIEEEQGKVVARGEVPTTNEGLGRLRAQYQLPAGAKVALETGTSAFFVARVLTAWGLCRWWLTPTRCGLRPSGRGRRATGATPLSCARASDATSTAPSSTCRRLR